MSARLLLAVVLAVGVLNAGCGAASPEPAGHLHLRVSSRVSLYDVPLNIQVSGLRPGEVVTLDLASRGHQWAAHATFRARAPVLDLSNTAPVSGSYRGMYGMGLFEALAPRDRGNGFGPVLPTVFTLTAAAPGSGTAAVTLTRELTGAGVTCAQQDVARTGFYGLYCAPPHGGKEPPVLVFGGSEGGLSTASTARLLASRGFPALALAYFGEPGLPSALERIPLEYFARAARWLSRQPGVNAQDLTVWGDSRGSEAALLLGAYFPTVVHAVIAGSPSAVVNGAVSLRNPVPSNEPAWMLHGKPLPSADPGASSADLIPVQRIRGPVLLLVGGQDQLWPSPVWAQNIISELDSGHDRYSYHEALFPDAGHLVGAAFPYAYSPPTVREPIGTLDLGGTSFANSVAGTKAWNDVLAFLTRLS